MTSPPAAAGAAAGGAAGTAIAATPSLCVLPGLDGTEVLSRPFVAGLAGCCHTRVIAYPAAGPHRYEALLSHVRAAVADLPSYYLLGSSFGGPLAMMLASVDALRVRGLILAATFARLPMPRLAPLRFTVAAPVVWTLRAARRIPIWLKPADDPLRRAKAETWSRTPASVLAARARAALAVDARASLARVTAPVLCVTYERDRVVPAACADEIRRLRPEARHAVLPGAHLALFSDPAPLAAEVRDFIAQCEAAG